MMVRMRGMPTWALVALQVGLLALLIAAVVAVAAFWTWPRLAEAQSQTWQAIPLLVKTQTAVYWNRFLPTNTQCYFDAGTLAADLEYLGDSRVPAASNTVERCRSLLRWAAGRDAKAIYVRFYIGEAQKLTASTTPVGGEVVDTMCAIYRDTSRLSGTSDSTWDASSLVVQDDDGGSGGHCTATGTLAAGYYVAEFTGRQEIDRGKRFGLNFATLASTVQKPSAPTNLAATVSGRNATVTWRRVNDRGSTATSFDVRYQKAGGNWSIPETVKAGAVVADDPFWRDTTVYRHTFYNLDPISDYTVAVRSRNQHFTSGWKTSVVRTQTGGIVTPPAPGSTSGQPTVVPTPSAHNLRLVSQVSYTLDVNEANRLRVNIAAATWDAVGSVRFSCAFDADGPINVRTAADAVDYSPTRDVRMHKLSTEGLSLVKSPNVIVTSRVEQDAACVARIYASAAGTGEYLETNQVRLRWQPEGRTLFRKEEAFINTPGGAATWLFLPPVFFGVVIAGVTRNAGATLMAVSAALGLAVWFTESPPILWALVLLTAASGVLVMMQLGFRGR